MKKQRIKIDELCSSALYLYKYELSGICEGPCVYIQANVHGAEVQGNAVIWQLVKELQTLKFKGTIILVPQANPYGASQRMGAYTYGRFNPATGDNWNRMYLNLKELPKSQGKLDIEKFVSEHGNESEASLIKKYKELIATKLEEYRAHHSPYGMSENKAVFLKLQEMASAADIVLDLHTGPIATRYIYTPEYLKEHSKDLNFPHNLVIPNEFGGAMDEACFMPWYELYNELKKNGVTLEHLFEAYTIELGSEECINMKEAQIDAQKILSFLAKRGVLIDYQITKNSVEQHYCELADYRMYRAPHSGLIEFTKKPGEHFKRDDVLAVIYRFDSLEDLEKSQTLIKAQTDGIVINHTTTSNIKQGMDLLECFTLE